VQFDPRVFSDLNLVVFLDDRHGRWEVYCAAPLVITSLSLNASGSELTVSWSSLPGNQYVLQTGNEPGSLADATGSIISQGLTTQHTLSVDPAAPALFCRVRLIEDGAGLSQPLQSSEKHPARSGLIALARALLPRPAPRRRGTVEPAGLDRDRSSE
jgi:hypothetical protein